MAAFRVPTHPSKLLSENIVDFIVKEWHAKGLNSTIHFIAPLGMIIETQHRNCILLLHLPRHLNVCEIARWDFSLVSSGLVWLTSFSFIYYFGQVKLDLVCFLRRTVKFSILTENWKYLEVMFPIQFIYYWIRKPVHSNNGSRRTPGFPTGSFKDQPYWIFFNPKLSICLIVNQ